MKKDYQKGLAASRLLIIILLLGVIIWGTIYYFTNQIKRNFITMGKDYISELRALVTEEKMILPEVGGSQVLISVSKISTSKNLTKSPFGENWVLEKSYIIIKNEGTEYNPVYNYYIALEDEGGNCIELTREAKLSRDDVVKECNITEYAETNAVYLN